MPPTPQPHHRRTPITAALACTSLLAATIGAAPAHATHHAEQENFVTTTVATEDHPVAVEDLVTEYASRTNQLHPVVRDEMIAVMGDANVVPHRIPGAGYRLYVTPPEAAVVRTGYEARHPGA